ncbi:cysteine desulfurase [Alicyclobacillus tengchongensis]|nr:cysteine desulfurase [Alicyclobacillus tengchongensis]
MIYLDNAATTPLAETVLKAMEPYLTSDYGNPSSTHTAGRQARQAVEQARRTIATWLDCDPRDLIFTSGGTEADNAALVGAYLGRQQSRKHIVASAIEHHAVLHTLSFLESLGAEVTLVPVDRYGLVDPADVVRCLRPDTALVSVMAINNELGTIEPVEEMARLVKRHDPQIIVHSDMVQALPVQRIGLVQTDIDMATFSAHKIHGPKGIGLLYVRKHTPWQPLLYGGNQEQKRRGGTENVAGAIGFAAAIDVLARHFDEHVAHLVSLRDVFWASLADVPGVHRLSPPDAAPSILNVAFDGVRNDVLLMRLDLEGVMASAGSACTAGSLEPSHVIEACGLGHVREAVRFSFSWQNTIDEIKQAARVVKECVQLIRSRFTVS